MGPGAERITRDLPDDVHVPGRQTHVQARPHKTQQARRIFEHLGDLAPGVARQLEQEPAAVAGQCSATAAETIMPGDLR